MFSYFDKKITFSESNGKNTNFHEIFPVFALNAFHILVGILPKILFLAILKSVNHLFQLPSWAIL